MSGRLSSDQSRSLSRSSQSRSGLAHDPDSMRHPSTPGRSSNPNVFSDEYSLEPLDSEQSTLTPRSLSFSSNASSHTLRSSLPHHQKQTPVNEDDLLENPFRDEARVSFDDESPHRSSLPQKGFELSYRNSITSNSSAPSTAQRSQSTSSRFSIPPRALSPYTGATGPSHPYALYPQLGVSRSDSVATTSTIRPVDGPLIESSGPQHPYAMYSQNVVEEDLEDSSIPLGFPGHGQESYQRPPNRAADDVGDLIGPDGYTEQLPPYSRYPEGASPKLEASVDGLPEAAVILDQPNSNNERDLAASETSSRTLVASSQPDSRANRPPDEPPVTGVMAFEEKLKRRGKKRVCCGLPVWTLVLISVVMIVGGSIGGAIGGILGAKKAAEASAEDDVPTTTTITVPPRTDATPFSGTPYNVPPIPTDTLSSSDISSRSVPEEQITNPHSKRASDVGDRPWFCWWNSTVMEFFLYINQTTKVTRYDTSSSLVDSSSTTTTDDDDDNKALTTDSLSKRGNDTPDYYPRRIKMEEKRDYAQAQAPYCQQMQVMDDGSIKAVSPATIGISVNEPTPATTVTGTGSATETYTAMAQYQSICYCVSLTD
ncbi:hypothetical protein BJX68DRAFT_225080 [Aspergillus pseudodeflectus]|uniref:DUF7820 domain-containing protein n=1 Tax=Aspergillus pseudodeflectus TaxID=176178 RepID=A0ABR4LAA6_9EURO